MIYFIQIKMRNFGGVGDIIFEMSGADKDIVKWVIDTYGRPGYEVRICPEISEEPHEKKYTREYTFETRFEEINPADLNIRIINCLRRSNYCNGKDRIEKLGDIANWPKTRIKYIRNMGDRSADELIRFLKYNKLREVDNDTGSEIN